MTEKYRVALVKQSDKNFFKMGSVSNVAKFFDHLKSKNKLWKIEMAKEKYVPSETIRDSIHALFVLKDGQK